MVTNILVVIVGILNIISKYIRAYEILIVGKFIAGLYCGIFTGVLPLYLMEVTPHNLRGFAGGLIGSAINFGIFISNIVALPQLFGNEDLWPIVGGFILLPALFNFSLFCASESPKYLYINCGDKEGAKKSKIK